MLHLIITFLSPAASTATSPIDPVASPAAASPVAADVATTADIFPVASPPTPLLILLLLLIALLLVPIDAVARQSNHQLRRPPKLSSLLSPDKVTNRCR